MTPTRVMFVHSALDSGGAERALIDLLCTLDPLLIEASVALFRPGSWVGRVPSGVQVRSDLGSSGRDPLVLLRLVAAMRDVAPDVVVVLERDAIAFWGRWAASLARVPHVVQWIHRGAFDPATAPGVAWRAATNRPLDAHTDLFVCVSENQADFAVEQRLPRERIRVIRNGVDIERFVPGDKSGARAALGIAADAPVVGMVSRMVPLKRHDLLIEALARLQDVVPDVRGLLVGDGPSRPSLEAQCARLGLAGRVVFAGDSAGVEEMIPAMDVLAIVSDTESFGIVGIEALACAVPVVATRCGGVEEFIVHGETGLLVPCDDAAALAEALAALLTDPARRRAMASTGRERMLADYSLERVTHQWTDLLKEIADR